MQGEAICSVEALPLLKVYKEGCLMAKWTPLFCGDGKFYTREQTRPVKVGKVTIGGGAPVSIQSMTVTKTDDIDATVAQIHRLEEAGCEIARVAVPNEKAARALTHIKAQINIPLVADIHFDYRMAILAIEAGVDKIRWNPGNIRDKRKVEAIVKGCKERGIPIRIGVNAGSLDPDLLMKYGGPTPEAMVESAAKEIALLEEWGFEDIVVSLKSSDVMDMVKAYLLFAQKFPYPTHLGVTEAGAPPEGVVWSAIGIGTVLMHGVGDTIRVSLATDPVEEVKAAKMILRAVGLRREGVRIIACPSCGRCEVDLFELVEQVKSRVGHIVEPLDIAVMGCVVNGPGEARIADLGIAAGRGKAALFVEGEVVKTIQEGDIVEALATLAEEVAEKKRERRTANSD